MEQADNFELTQFKHEVTPFPLLQTITFIKDFDIDMKKYGQGNFGQSKGDYTSFSSKQSYPSFSNKQPENQTKKKKSKVVTSVFLKTKP